MPTYGHYIIGSQKGYLISYETGIDSILSGFKNNVSWYVNGWLQRDAKATLKFFDNNHYEIISSKGNKVGELFIDNRPFPGNFDYIGPINATEEKEII